MASVSRKTLLRIVLIAVLCVSLARPARSETITAARDQIVIGIVGVTAGLTVLVTFLVLHAKHHKRTITGCVSPGASGMSLTDEKDKRTYALAGDTAGVKPGDRMSLEGKPKESDKTLALEVHKVTGDFGVCQKPTGSP
jgi:hypothetical protein